MRILFVAMGHVVHTARWIDQVADLGWDLHLFPAEEQRLNTALRNVTVHGLFRREGIRGQGGQPNVAALDPSVRQTALFRWPLARGITRAELTLRTLTCGRSDFPARLARVINSLRPDVIHAMEMQKAGYILSDAAPLLRGRRLPPIIYSSWGSDIYYFGRLPDHARRIRAALEICDYHIADCQRDVELARQFGFRGESLGVLPGGGGFDIQGMQALRQPGPSSARRVVVLKGYHHDEWVGRALVGLHAIALCAEALQGYNVVIYSSNPRVAHSGEFVARLTGVPVTILPPTEHSGILQLMGRARVAIGLSTSDGTPNSMLEAMAMGALPIQSDVGSTGEWIQQGSNGWIVPPEDAEAVAVALRRALRDDAMVDRAAEINLELTRERIDRPVVGPRVIRVYERASASLPLARRNSVG